MGLWLPLGVLGLWCALALLGPWLPVQPNQIDLTAVLAQPSPGAWLGHDDLGRPVLDRLVAGARVSLEVALGVVTVSALAGSLLGGAAAYAGGWLDLLLVRLVDLFLAFPGILLAIALAGVMGPGVDNLILALSAVGWVGYARLARAQVLSLRERDQVAAARVLGVGRWRILTRHLLPLSLAPLLVEATQGVAGAVVAEAGLSFLGLGVQPPESSWGSLIRDGSRYLLVAPHLAAAPGLAIFLVVLSVNLLGDRLRDRLDVRLHPPGQRRAGRRGGFVVKGPAEANEERRP